jgi:amino acid transporter
MPILHQKLNRCPQYWKDPGAINRAGLVENIGTDRFLAILSVIVQAAFSFQGMELVAMSVADQLVQGLTISDHLPSAASETENPRRNIAKAVRRVFYRIMIFYVSWSILCVHEHVANVL